MEAIAPTRLAASWDNVGLLLGGRDWPAARILICLDVTSRVVSEAMDSAVDAIVSYHPVFFDRPGRITDETADMAPILALAKSGIAVYSPHTAWDAVEDGLADWLAEGIGPGSVRPIEPAVETRSGRMVSIVTDVPRSNTEAVRDAMAASGAGHIGNYDCCATCIESVGSFRPHAGANPAIGAIDTLEQVEEHRLQMVCDVASLAEALSALRRAHPYEEPPVQVFEMKGEPSTNRGAGRVLKLDHPAPISTITERLKAHLGVSSLRLVQGVDAPEAHTVVGCCPGAGGALLSDAESAGATLYVTGEMRHHDLLAARERGTSVLLAGHAHTEQRGLDRLVDRLQKAMPEVSVARSVIDASPWTVA